jgi:uncharacterized membrane protein YczE
MKYPKLLFGIEILAFLFTYILAITALNHEYLFGWVSHNWGFYLILCAIALFLLVFKKSVISISMMIGITIGIFVGNFLGHSLKGSNEQLIIEGMEAEMVYRLQHHPGFEIWIGTILFAIVVGIVVQFLYQRIKNRV